MVTYNNGIFQGDRETGHTFGLTIADASSHEALMKSITTALRLALGSTDKFNGDTDKLVTLVQFLEEILPEERELDRGYRYAKS